MRLWPDTLTGRALVVMLAGIVLSNAIGIAIFSGERLDLLTSARGNRLAERVSAAARLMDDSRPEERRKMVRRLRRPGLRMFWSLDPITENINLDWQTGLVRGALSAQLENYEPDRLRLSVSTRPHFKNAAGAAYAGKSKGGRQETSMWRDEHGKPGGSKGILLGAYRLTDGSWLNFAAPLSAFRPFWMTRFFLAIVGTTLIVLAISVWAVRRAIRPLSMFEGAAERLGVDMNAPPLPEEGPREVRRASHAFNEMQGRLQTFVRDRTQMLAAISHDLKTPITRLRLRAEFIDSDEQKVKMLSDLDDIQSMINATLSFARDDFANEKQRSFDLAVLLRGICDEFQDLGADVSSRGPAHLACIGRPSALKRAFSNLIDNSIKYGGACAVSCKLESGSCIVLIKDRGPGLNESDRERVFEPFYRIEDSRSRETGGVGLGLPIARSIIRGHGGEVLLSNRAEGGARATITLPIASYT